MLRSLLLNTFSHSGCHCHHSGPITVPHGPSVWDYGPAVRLPLPSLWADYGPLRSRAAPLCGITVPESGCHCHHHGPITVPNGGFPL